MLINEELLQEKLNKVLEKFSLYTKSLRSGKPNIEVFNSIMIPYYGSPMQLNYISQILLDAMSATIKLNDKGADNELKNLVKKNIEEQLNVMATESEKGVLKINFPPLTSEVKEAIIKEMHKVLEEEYKRSARSIRQTARDELKKIEKVPEDDVKREEEKIQKMLDNCIDELDKLASLKEHDLKTV